jgi:hypothetical protein
VSKDGQKFILEKKFASQTPIIFICFFLGGGGLLFEIFYFNKKWLSYGPQKKCIAKSPKGLIKTF